MKRWIVRQFRHYCYLWNRPKELGKRITLPAHMPEPGSVWEFSRRWNGWRREYGWKRIDV